MTKKITSEEKELLELFNQGKLKRAKNASKEIQRAQELACEHVKQNIRVNIKLSQFDLERIKRIAVAEGIPYQALIASILHKYVNQDIMAIKQD